MLWKTTQERIRWGVYQTSVAPVLIAASDKGICCLSFNEGEAELRARFPHAELLGADAAAEALFKRAIAVVEGKASGDDIPLDTRGSSFQEQVWQALRAIPAGETRSYGELAKALGRPKASRAVGGANGANFIAALIPCHRVIAADGGLGGYAYGTEIKAKLLEREGALA